MGIENPKYEARNSKQIRMPEAQKSKRTTSHELGGFCLIFYSRSSLGQFEAKLFQCCPHLRSHSLSDFNCFLCFLSCNNRIFTRVTSGNRIRSQFFRILEGLRPARVFLTQFQQSPDVMCIWKICVMINQKCLKVFFCALLRVVHDPDQDCS